MNLMLWTVQGRATKQALDLSLGDTASPRFLS
jgi:hypothetical protein